MNKQLSDLKILLISNAFVSIIVYISNIGLANRLGPTEFGEYTYVLILGTLLGQFVIFGTDDTAVSIYLKDGQKAISKIFNCRIINFAIISFIVSIWFVVKRDTSILYSLIIASQGLSLSYIYEIKRNNKKYTIIFLCERIIYLIFLWIGILYSNQASIDWILLSLLFWTFLSICYQVRDNGGQLSLTTKSPSLIIWKNGFWFVFFTITKYMYGGGTRFFIKEYLGYAALGIYSVAWQFIPLVTIFLAQVTKSFRFNISESIHKRNYIDFKNQMIKILNIAFIPILFLAIFFFFFGQTVILRLFSEKYADSIPLLRWISIYFIVVSIDTLNTILWVSLRKLKTFGLIHTLFGGICFVIMWNYHNIFTLSDYLLTVVGCHFLATAISITFLIPNLTNVFRENK